MRAWVFYFYFFYLPFCILVLLLSHHLCRRQGRHAPEEGEKKKNSGLVLRAAKHCMQDDPDRAEPGEKLAQDCAIAYIVNPTANGQPKKMEANNNGIKKPPQHSLAR